MAAAAWIVPLAISAVGMIQQSGAAYKAGKAAAQTGADQKEAKYFEAAQLDRLAGQELATSQRVALDEKRKGEVMASRALALSAASGGSATDPTVITLVSGIAGETAYKQAVAIYEGKARARNLRLSAGAARMEGETAEKTGQQISAGYRYAGQAAAINTSATLFSRFYPRAMGEPKPSPTARGSGDTNLIYDE